MLSPATYFDLSACSHAALFHGCSHVWQALSGLKDYVRNELRQEGLILPKGSGIPLSGHLVVHAGRILAGDEWEISSGSIARGELTVEGKEGVLQGASVIMAGAVLMGEGIRIGKGVLVEPGALIKGPALIGDLSEIRQTAYLRGYCVIGRRAVVGHATEVKHSVFLDDAKAGHFAYLGDSILGHDVNLGAGTKCANLRFLPGNVMVDTANGRVDSGLRKFGAILGDRVQTGCNSVTNPGTVMGPNCLLMPNATAASGVHPAKSLLR
ncbi:MAG: hypothetical protein Q4G66_01965 [bacterium]|nr:hypothetical protein [bacterium]